MKFLLASTLALLALPLCAQTAGTTPAPSPSTQAAAMSNNPMLSSLTAEEKTKLVTLHGQVIDQSPDLKKEETDLMQKGLAMQTSGEATDADKQAFMAQAHAHADKVRAAMVKADPSVQAIFDKIKVQAEKLQAQMQGAH